MPKDAMTGSPHDRRSRRGSAARGRSVLAVALGSLLLIQFVTVGSVVLSARLTGADALRDQMFSTLELIGRGAAASADEFLARAEREALLVARLAGDGHLEVDDDVATERFLTAQLQADEVLNGVFVGRQDGSFVFVSRAPDEGPGAMRIKTIETEPERLVELRWVDADGELIRTESDPTDTFDPRERPWYEAALDGREAQDDLQSLPIEPAWTDPYVFFSSRRPGVTASVPLLGPDGEPLGVYGADVELAELSAFLGSLDVSATGEAFMLDQSGAVMAYPDPDLLAVETSDGTYAPVQASELGDPLMQEAVLAAGSTGAAPGEPVEVSFDADDQPAAAVVVPLGAGSGWLVAAAAPEDDFVGNIRDSQRQSTLWAFAITLVVLGLLIPIVVVLVRRLLGLQRRADTDSLTQLLNRRAFDRTVDGAIDDADVGDGTLCLAVVDVDDFKTINDEHGHPMGDEVLVAIAGRLIDELRAGDEVGRTGGDEFQVLVRCPLDEGLAILRRMASAVRGPFSVNDMTTVEISISMGIAEWRPGADRRSLAAEADAAMYQAKQKGRDRIELSRAAVGSRGS